MVLLSAQGMDAVKIAEVTFASPDRVRDVLHNAKPDGKGRAEFLALCRYLRSLHPKQVADRDRARQLQPAPHDQNRPQRRGLGCGEQR